MSTSSGRCKIIGNPTHPREMPSSALVLLNHVPFEVLTFLSKFLLLYMEFWSYFALSDGK